MKSKTTQLSDGDVVRLARRIDLHREKITDLVYAICERHPNGEQLRKTFADNGYPMLAWAVHVVAHDLEHPGDWETSIEHGIAHKAATKAVKNRT